MARQSSGLGEPGWISTPPHVGRMRETGTEIVPIYEFECEKCGERFEELVAADGRSDCPSCGASSARRVYSAVSPPGHQPRGAAVRSDESRRREREAARQERLASARAKRAGGESPR